LGDPPYRWNWEAPIALSNFNQDIVYFGSNRFHRSMDQGETFETLSGDLTKGGKPGDVSYGTLTTIHESPLRFGLIYAGSDDGLIHVTKDAGENWKKISDNLPQDFWVSQVFASKHSESRVYASLNGYRWDNFEPMIFVSDDYGTTWKNLSAGLPKEPVNVIKEDPENENILYVGTDHGAYVSIDRGITFHALMEGLPRVAVHDLVVHPREKDLVLGTHGRSIYIGNVEHLQQMDEALIARNMHVFPVNAITYSTRWGSKWSYWSDPIRPEVTVGFYSKFAGKGKIEVIFKEEVVTTQETYIDKGLNYVDLALETNGSFKNLLEDEQKESYKAAENGDYHLVAGDYKIRVSAGSASHEVDFTIREPRERQGRKE
jgi:hypothetical protein